MPNDEATDLVPPKAAPGLSGELPRDLQELAARRLGVACLVVAGVWGLQLLLNNVVGPILSPDAPLDDAWPVPGNPVAVVVVVVSLALYAYTRSQACNCTLSLDLGLGYEVLVAFAIGIVNQWTPNVTGLSWICVLVLVFPMIIPNTRAKTLIAALAAATMDPIGLVITGMRGVEIPSGPVILWTYLPNYICALLAVLPSHVITRLSSQVKHARELGSYQLGELLGRGGMGEVYAARHRLLRRPAAIKLVRPSSFGAMEHESVSTLVQRFKREAEAAASLHSPHTIALYDFGVTGGGDFYYVMELLRGLDLETVVNRFGPLPPARVVYLLGQACHSLAEAHAVGLVHRDVKPANLYTCWVGLEPDFVKVLDFGLVKGQVGDSREQTKLTAPNMATGTPAYMSPELARGEEVDGRSDIYAIGCVAYWLLTGRLVFEAETAMKTMVAHIRSTPLPPSRMSELEISRSLDELVLACLDKDPANRPQDADELSRHLAACDAGELWSRNKAAEWWRLNLPDLIPDRPTA